MVAKQFISEAVYHQRLQQIQWAWLGKYFAHTTLDTSPPPALPARVQPPEMDVRKYRLCKLPHSQPASSYLILPWLWKHFWGGGCAIIDAIFHTHTYVYLPFPDKQPSTFNPLILWENAISLSSHCNNNLFIACFPLMTAIDNLISYNYYKLFCLTQHSSSSSLPVWLGVNMYIAGQVIW